jgi:glycosyltransferase involved in cell wall biosynthesis
VKASRRKRRERPRIAVYAIARNEENHVERWAASTDEADLVVLVDTGSTDETIRRARKVGVDVHTVSVEPFRYDAARNQALALLPRDIDLCVALDIDEVLVSGWRPHLEEAWRQGASRVRCSYEWPWSDVHPPQRFTTTERIHARHGYRWRFPVHEELVPLGPEVQVASGAGIRHLRDSIGTRPHYLPLLRLRAAEHPDDGRTAYLLGSEARLNGLRDEAIFHERRALELRLAPNERLHATLTLSYLEPESREDWLLDACADFPERREPWCELGQLHLERGEWRACRAAAHAALRIMDPADDYLSNVLAWGPWPERLAALASMELGDLEWAVHHARRARDAAPMDDDQAALFDRASTALSRRRPARLESAEPSTGDGWRRNLARARGRG